ncbi:F510_1955 family glycosylhydrolase [Cytobacillus dafuensis]|uniref:Sortilin N-terminal domain-containing protein n=1 Tax=Cytobacillus dafuensis TaxID=1742359 RepID=A0A5B8Z6P4_CYTDA|nr:hypothetical protein [Cytobacillus dafuensis]QED48720.1 hypothetical protein FSZ17_16490 [Cytobacillus dafuensis]
MKISKKYFLPFMFILIAAGCSSANDQDEGKLNDKKTEPIQQTVTYNIQKAEPQRLEQIYGLGYPGNDEGLYLSSQEGIKINTNNGWLEGSSQKHEYVGFQATKDGFISGGHPEKGSNMKDPIGIVKSIDRGATVKPLSFYGEGDFHFLSAGYDTNVIYIINEKALPELEPGVFISEDEGKSWKPLKLNGLESDTLGMIAAHPTNGSIMAMSTRSGVFISEDKGQNLKLATAPVMATALAFSENELYYSSVENNKVLFHKIDLSTNKAVEIEIPYLNYDNPITFISVNMKNQNTLSFATYLNDVYESTDGGENWNLVLKNGKIE